MSTASLYVEPDMTPERCLEVIGDALALDCHFSGHDGVNVVWLPSLRQAVAQLANHYRDLVDDLEDLESQAKWEGP